MGSIHYSNFISGIESKDIHLANMSLMKELGDVYVKDKKQFVYLLNESGIAADINMPDGVLVDLFIDNIGSNPELALGASMLTCMNNKISNADGTETIDEKAAKDAYSAMRYYFDGEYSNASSDVGAIAEAVAQSAKLASNITQGSQRKKYGVSDTLQKQVDAKNAMSQQILAARQAEALAKAKEKESKQKTLRTVLIIGGSVAVLGIGLIIYFKTRK